MKGTNYNGEWDGWYGPSGLRNASDYDIDSIKKSPAGKAIGKLGLMPSNEKIESLRTKATVECTLSESLIEGIPCKPLEQPCLFNVKEDPCEQVNLAKTYVLNWFVKYSCFDEFSFTGTHKFLRNF